MFSVVQDIGCHHPDTVRNHKLECYPKVHYTLIEYFSKTCHHIDPVGGYQYSLELSVFVLCCVAMYLSLTLDQEQFSKSLPYLDAMLETGADGTALEYSIPLSHLLNDSYRYTKKIA